MGEIYPLFPPAPPAPNLEPVRPTLPGSIFAARQPTQKPLTAIDPSTLEGVDPLPREWIVEGWLPIGAVTILYADGGIGKTLLAQQLMTACAVGGLWCGNKVLRCPSIGLFCEDDENELHSRQVRINAAMGTNFSDLAKVRWLSGVGQDNQLIIFSRSGEGSTTQRFREIEALACRLNPRLIVIDTAADTFGGNENDRGQVRQFVGRALTKLAQDFNAAVLLNAHPSRTGLGVSGDIDGGSTAWSNSARSRWALTRATDGEVDHDTRILSRRKSNYGSIGGAIELRWIEGALLPIGTMQSDASPENRQDAAEAMFLALLAEYTADDRPVSMAPPANNFAPLLFGRRLTGPRFTRRDYEIAMDSLIAAGRIREENYGRPHDQRRRIQLCEPDESDAKAGAEADQAGE